MSPDIRPPDGTEIDTESLKKEIKQELLKREILMGLDDDEIDLFELGKVLWRRKVMIIGLPLIIALVAVVYSLTLQNQFKSQATIFVHAKGGGSSLMGALGALGGLGGMMGLSSGGGSAEYLMTHLKSKTLATEIISRFGIATHPMFFADPSKVKRDDLYKLMEGLVSVTKDKDGLLSIAAETTSATFSAALAEGYVELLYKFSKGPAKQKREFIQSQLDKTNLELVQAEQAFKEFQDANRLFQIEDQAKAVIDNLVKLETERVQSVVALAMQDSLLKSLGNVPDLVRVEAQKVSEEAKQKSLAEAIAKVEKKIDTMPTLGLQYARLMRDLKVREKVFATLTEQFEMAKISEAEEGSSFEVIDRPQVPERKSKPSRALIVILSGVTASLLTVFLAFFLEFLEKRSREEKKKRPPAEATA